MCSQAVRSGELPGEMTGRISPKANIPQRERAPPPQPPNLTIAYWGAGVIAFLQDSSQTIMPKSHKYGRDTGNKSWGGGPLNSTEREGKDKISYFSLCVSFSQKSHSDDFKGTKGKGLYVFFT